MIEDTAAGDVVALKWSAQTHMGRVRRNNEDAFLILTFDAQEVRYLGKDGEAELAGNSFIFAVSDGMGGAKAGEFASRVVLTTVTDLISREFHQKASGKVPDQPRLLGDFCRRIHAEVERVGRYYEECRGMGATLSLVWIVDRHLHFVHVGDSRIYRFPAEGGLVQLSEDHSVVGRLRREGKLDERGARKHPERNLLEQSIGSGVGEIEPQVGTVAIEPGDRFVICSDGVTDGIWDHSLEKYVRNPPPYLKGLAPAPRLIKEALESSGRDNLTAIVIDACPSLSEPATEA